jgi:predicted O-linked N-acetylglucosamine transferase (SPINDLY family)
MTLQQQLESGMSHHRAGRLAEAERIYCEILTRQPDHPEALHLLGVLTAQFGKSDAGMELIRRAIRLKPDDAEAHNNLGVVLRNRGQFADAIAAYRQAIRLKPDFAEAHNNLGIALVDVGQLDEAMAAARQAIGLKPDYAKAYNNLGNALRDAGQLDEAMTSYRRAIHFKPGLAEAHSNLLFTLHYHPGYDGRMIHEELARWSQQHAEPLKKLIQPHANNRDAERRLRIGYVSADFGEHPVGRFLLPMLEQHDHRQFEVFCYSNVARPGAITERLRTRAHHWRDIVNLNDEQAAALIGEDGIDILVDLAGHTPGNRLLVFARKPAPVQVSYLGYPGSTGLNTIDYRLTDRFADPPDLTDPFHTEALYRLPQTNWCFAEPEDAPPVEPPPASRRDHVTFGSFNNFAKITEAMLQVWGRILHEVPGSRLLLKAAAFGAASVCQRFGRNSAAQGIDASRLNLRGPERDHAAHLALYGEMDIALDTYPYHGTTTTCDALWMGVPVITLAGQTHVSRVGVSLLSNVGLPELVATTPDQYVQIAVDLARDRGRMDTLRRGMRARMLASPLMDAPRFARDVEGAYRQMWRNWCQPGGNWNWLISARS